MNCNVVRSPLHRLCGFTGKLHWYWFLYLPLFRDPDLVTVTGEGGLRNTQVRSGLRSDGPLKNKHGMHESTKILY
jgi:hypothetical protein